MHKISKPSCSKDFQDYCQVQQIEATGENLLSYILQYQIVKDCDVKNFAIKKRYSQQYLSETKVYEIEFYVKTKRSLGKKCKFLFFFLGVLLCAHIRGSSFDSSKSSANDFITNNIDDTHFGFSFLYFLMIKHL